MTRIHHGKTRRTRRVTHGPGRIAGPDLASRLRAAGIADDDISPADMDIDAFRMALARRIAMLINRWPGCRQPLCKRHRGCMAPQGHCSNRPDRPMSEERRRRGLARMQRLLARDLERREAAQRGASDG